MRDLFEKVILYIDSWKQIILDKKCLKYQIKHYQILQQKKINNIKPYNMKIKIISVLITITIFTSCASIPKETVQLSKVIGSDLVVLHNSHRKMVELYYDKIINDINAFVDEVYSPFVIHYVLNIELDKYKNGEPSIYGTIELAGTTMGKSETDDALNIMEEFIGDAKNQIEKKRNELLKPIVKQKRDVIDNINKSYENTIYANSTITGYLESTRKVKESQQEALSLIGLQGKDEQLNDVLLKASDIVNTALKQGKEIDIKSDEAYDKIEEIANQIKKITDKIK